MADIGVMIGMGASVLTLVLLLIPATREIVLSVINYLFQMLQSFLSVAPAPVKFLFFFFLVLFFISSIIGFFVGLNFFCAGPLVYTTASPINGLGIWMSSVVQENDADFGNLTKAQWQSVVNNESIIYSSPSTDTPEGMFPVSCVYGDPQITFFGIPFLDYRTWIIIYILIALLWAYIKFVR